MRGQLNVSKTHTLKCAAYNLGLLLRKAWGFCKPRNAEAGAAALIFAFSALVALVAAIVGQKTDWLIGWWLCGCAVLLVTIATVRCLRYNLKSRENAIL